MAKPTRPGDHGCSPALQLPDAPLCLFHRHMSGQQYYFLPDLDSLAECRLHRCHFHVRQCHDGRWIKHGLCLSPNAPQI